MTLLQAVDFSQTFASFRSKLTTCFGRSETFALLGLKFTLFV
ncbi:hypothetical protein X781_8980 [Mannheimia sp. USDA-ARS-USMARC-1261]|nr:hypothetical protein X781_8980 [Mannheimia sp. USDA-ARS-USMARC-1261]